jgi:hypothetical protein
MRRNPVKLTAATTADPASFENLFDIVTPLPVPWWPACAGLVRHG